MATSSGSSGNNSIGEFDIQAIEVPAIYDYIWWPSQIFQQIVTTQLLEI